jgi:hypothetical protein
MKINVTERQVFKQCRKRWQYEYVEQLIPIQQDSSAFWIGIGIHDALEAFYQQRNAIKALENWWRSHIDDAPDIVKNSSDETWQLMVSMIQQYVEFAKTADIGIEVISTPEKYIKMAIPRTVEGFLAGRIDLLTRWKGEVWVVDHKTVTSFVDQASLEFDDQTTAYMWLIQSYTGYKAAGAVYNQLKKKIPEEPQLLKTKHQLSKDKAIVTTAEIYLAAINKNELDPNDYVDILAYLKDNSQFFRREYIARTQHELKAFEDALVTEYYEMLRARLDFPRLCYRTATRECSWCSYALLCKAEAADDEFQAKEIKNALFTVKGTKGGVEV